MFVIEGKRPNIPENFIRNDNQNQDIQKIRQQQKSQSNFLLELDPSPDNMAKEGNNLNNININQNNESLNNNKIIDINVNIDIINNKDNINEFGLNNNDNEKTKKITHVIHNISKELQIFFENFKQRFKNETNANKINNNWPYLFLSQDMKMSIEIIKTNPGVVELVPYIINFLMNYEHFSSNTKICYCILHYINSLITNQSFFLEPYLHQILIIIISLILYEKEKDKDKDNDNLIYLDPIIRVKFYAIKILEKIIFKYFLNIMIYNFN